MVKDEIIEQVNSFPYWYHKIELPYGIVTPGWAPINIESYRIPKNFSGKRVLDVGAWDGYWTFEALKRGAKEVVAIDDFSDFLGTLSASDRKAWDTFDLCRKALGYSEDVCKRMEMSVYDVCDEKLGKFDIVLFFGTLYHLRHPLLALDKLSAVCTEEIFVESAILDDFSPYKGGVNNGYPGNQMVIEFYPEREYGNNRSNWWSPTAQCLVWMVYSAGFTSTDGWKLTDKPNHIALCRGFAHGIKKPTFPPSKVAADDFEGRIRDVISDPNNQFIPRVVDAGEIVDGLQIMHNGLKVVVDGYYGSFITKMLKLNKGVHEPQEERVFMEVLNYIDEGGTIVELGSYWAFYSMWFIQKITNAKCFMVEPEERFLAIGRMNFELNGFKGEFIHSKVGLNDFKVDEFMQANNLEYIDILHSDIQGAEIEMLLGAEKALSENKIGYIFIGTHGQKLHYDCTDFLNKLNYVIFASADFDNETCCYDGVLVAHSRMIKEPKPINIVLRS